MEDLIDLMVQNDSPSEVTDKIKDLIMQKAAEKIDELRPAVAASIFDDGNGQPEEVDQDPSQELE